MFVEDLHLRNQSEVSWKEWHKAINLYESLLTWKVLDFSTNLIAQKQRSVVCGNGGKSLVTFVLPKQFSVSLRRNSTFLYLPSY